MQCGLQRLDPGINGGEGGVQVGPDGVHSVLEGGAGIGENAGDESGDVVPEGGEGFAGASFGYRG